MAELVPQDRHRQIGNLLRADRTFVGFWLVHKSQIRTESASAKGAPQQGVATFQPKKVGSQYPPQADPGNAV